MSKESRTNISAAIDTEIHLIEFAAPSISKQEKLKEIYEWHDLLSRKQLELTKLLIALKMEK